VKYNYIVIEGNIGAGKTSLAKKIAAEYNAKLVLEQFADNPFLPKFYKEPDKYSFQLELSFLADRYQQLKKDMVNPDLFYSFIVADYYFMKSLIFAGSTLKDDEYKLYRQLFMIIYESLPKPDLYIYLHVNVENLLNNIQKRGRSYEKEIKSGYLEGIQNGYFEFFRQNPNTTYLVLDINQIDFVSNNLDYEKIKRAIFDEKHRSGINRIILE